MTKLLPVGQFHSKDRGNPTWVHVGIDAGVVRFRCAFLGVVLAIFIGELANGAQRAAMPYDRVIAQAVEWYFSTVPGYQKGDLITQSQIEKVIAKLESVGMKIPNAADVIQLGLADHSFLIRELSTAEGRKFMRKMAARSDMYSHLDRLSTIPRGQTMVRDLIRQKDGDKFVEYLATTKGGQRMGDMMGQARGGVDLNKPTGRIYTADDLTAALMNAVRKSAS